MFYLCEKQKHYITDYTYLRIFPWTIVQTKIKIGFIFGHNVDAEAIMTAYECRVELFFYYEYIFNTRDIV